MVYEHTVCDGIDLNFIIDGSDEENEEEWLRSSPVKYFTTELSLRGRLKRLLLRKPSTRIRLRIFDLICKLLLCILYIVRVSLDEPVNYQCNGQHCSTVNKTEALPQDDGSMKFSSTAINWYLIIWVDRPLVLWLFQSCLSGITLIKACLDMLIVSKGNFIEKATQDGFILELICSIPILLTWFYPPLLINLYVPGFLNVWLVKKSLENLFNDLHLTKQRFQTISVTLSQQLFLLVVSMGCLVFTTICGIQHIQRSSHTHPLTLFESFYFVIVTFSTVGYGDISPDNWLGQLFMLTMICLAFAFIPRQIEGIHSTWKERKKTGGEYSSRHAAGHRHVVVCTSHLSAEYTMDFLIEFYANRKLEDHIVVLLSSDEKDTSLQIILKDPKWAHRVIYMKGSALKDTDLQRCRLQQADACFILAPSKCQNRDEADQHTILRSWAIKDFAPQCRQYIQLFKTEHKLHVKFAEHVVCEDEFKYALLANNCLYPGLSTLVTLLLHTTNRELGEVGMETWQHVYGRHSGNEVYHIQLSKSVFFQKYEGQSFTNASADAHKRFGVCLIGVLDVTNEEPRLQLNPGSSHKLKASDYCFYIGEFKEEFSKIKCQNVIQEEISTKDNTPITRKNKSLEQVSEVLEKWIKQDLESENYGEESVFNSTITNEWGQEIARRIRRQSEVEIRKPDTFTEDSAVIEAQVNANVGKGRKVPCVLQVHNDMGQDQMVTGPPPVTLYSGNRRTLCHLMGAPRPKCCLQWGENCEHCTYKNANDDRWQGQLIILAVEHACAGIHNFIVPLRSHFISRNSLSPIILLLEDSPDDMFLSSIGHFPLVYWMKGKISCIDDLLLAGINKVSHLVVVNHDAMRENMEETMVDSETIVAVQTILKLFPNTNIITELSQATSIRFMQFHANSTHYAKQDSRLQKVVNGKMSSALSHIFRQPFAAGQVFSASMLNSLLYQTFVKGYLITLVRLLLGIDAEENSGHLSSVRVQRMTYARYSTYGDLYTAMATTTGEIPIAIYRTEENVDPMTAVHSTDNKNNNHHECDDRKFSTKMSGGGLFSKSSNKKAEKETADLAALVKSRLVNLGMKASDYADTDSSANTISYVILNPTPMRKLRVGDIVYVIQPSSMAAIPSSKTRWNMVRNAFTSRPSVSRSFSNPAASNISPTSKNNGNLLKRTSSGSGELYAKESEAVFVFSGTKRKPSNSVKTLSFKEPEREDLLQSEIIPEPGILERKVSRFTVHTAVDE
ncbi:potassium channel subfamily T member 1-like isoform X2 [Ostrea edulis]|uniref:potassium channel subfamily T member 1-like isoform X2 n=1 Tax=Ostrea edulis TaxID=37623 RepID=UPI0024AF11F2|nr:potassium channel subfamily T member 1-like isoform X2 [Ostrea edulis]XP_055998391.1 potassium channel subfamily T member 1-like isoform X2 [Ostrea edulis]